MNNLRALLLDLSAHPKKQMQRQIQNVTLCPAASAEELTKSVEAGTADIVVIDTEVAGLSNLTVIAEIRKSHPTIPAIIVMKKRLTDKDWISAAAAPSLQFIQSPVSDSELFFHVTRFFPPKESSLRHALIAQTIPALRSKNGRLDAQLVAKLFGLSMTDIAANVGVSRQALTKTPDSLSVQSALYHFERVASGLKEVTGSDKGLKIWLNAPNKSFDEHTPLEVIKLGQIELLAGWVDDARLGSPA